MIPDNVVRDPAAGDPVGDSVRDLVHDPVHDPVYIKLTSKLNCDNRDSPIFMPQSSHISPRLL